MASSQPQGKKTRRWIPPLISWMQKIEPHALIVVWIFGMVTAIITVAGVISILSPCSAITLVVMLIIFLVATAIVFIPEIHRRLYR